ncbi:MAG TPA: universal stress protein [Desulfovibrio sp.]|jgi:nucleotide-binding universal stress UspA family protein|uniref:universal stress protein n=1 Tax=Desulfovibrio TaxID=872 RepID=UPI002A406C31|nr:universal stress protein [Desulfovibrio sp.]MDY0306334.1 universal stress protein [Desulfovibrionaceae bacterium]HMM38519.1 universal stress protein [Desulfovibrio sp.]
MNEKNILVAFDGSENAQRAVDYVAKMAGGIPGAKVRLLYVERLPERDFFETEAAWKDACRVQADAARQALASAVERLKAAGLPAGAVDSSYLPSCRSPRNEAPACSLGTSIARDIVGAMDEGGFGTVVIGRRGVSKAEEFLFGSVSTKVMHLAKDCAVWVVA